MERGYGRLAADDTTGSLCGVLSLDLPGTRRMAEAARVKARMALTLGDCFAIATAAARVLVLLAGDPEILGLTELPCDVEDLRTA
jgi:hypothetical protein